MNSILKIFSVISLIFLSGKIRAQDHKTEAPPLLTKSKMNRTNDNDPIMNGFVMSNLRIPLDEVRQGGPPRDGIPAIDNPVFLAADEAGFLRDDHQVLAISKNGKAKVYPIRIMNYHEVVNDFFGEDPVIITFCPLCGSGIAFDGRIDGKDRTFGVSGLLYNSDVLLYDRETGSLWSQLMGQAVSGPSVDQRFKIVPMEQTTWESWKTRYPETEVLSTKTGFSRDYNRLPYFGYEDSNALYFPVNNASDLYSNKEKVIGISIDGVHKAYAFSKLRTVKGLPLQDMVNGKTLQVYFDKNSNNARITDGEGNLIEGTTLFWFAWFAFHPDTDVY